MIYALGERKKTLYRGHKLWILGDEKQKTMSERVAEFRETIQLVQRKDAMGEELDMLLFDRQHKSAHNRTVDGQNLVHSGNAIIEQRDVAQHLCKAVSNQRSTLTEFAVEMMEAETDHRTLTKVLREQEVFVFADEGTGDDKTKTIDADLRAGDLIT